MMAPNLIWMPNGTVSRISAIYLKPPREKQSWTASELAAHMQAPRSTVRDALAWMVGERRLKKIGHAYHLTQKGAVYGAAYLWAAATNGVDEMNYAEATAALAKLMATEGIH